jgi:hypothetical protein
MTFQDYLDATVSQSRPNGDKDAALNSFLTDMMGEVKELKRIISELPYEWNVQRQEWMDKGLKEGKAKLFKDFVKDAGGVKEAHGFIATETMLDDLAKKVALLEANLKG